MTALTTACSALPAAILLFSSSLWAQNPPVAAKPAAGVPEAPAPDPQKPEAPVAAPAVTAEPAPSAETSPSEPPPTPASAQPPAESPSEMAVGDSPYGNGNAAAPAPPPEQAPAPAEDESKDAPATLFDGGADYAIGGFGGIGVMYTRFAGKNAAQICGEGGVIIDHALTLGGGGCGIAREINAEAYGPAPHDPNDRMHFGYGGAIVRYHFFSREMTNVSVGGLIGAGGLSIGTWDGDGTDWEGDYTHRRSDAVFVFEPQVGGHANLTRWLRVGVSAGYRLVSGVNTEGLTSGDLGGPTLGGTIQGGWF